MKWILVLGMLMATSLTFAQAPSATLAAAPSSPTSPTVTAPAVVVPAVTSVASASAPPEWVQEFLQVVSGLPVVGPWVSKALVYLQALAGLLTALVAFLIAASAALKSALNWAGLDAVVAWVEAFQQSKWMYWLTAFSNVPVHVTPAQASAPPSGQAPPAAVAAKA